MVNYGEERQVMVKYGDWWKILCHLARKQYPRISNLSCPRERRCESIANTKDRNQNCVLVLAKTKLMNSASVSNIKNNLTDQAKN